MESIIGVEKLTLGDGRELTLDLRKISIKDFRFATANDTDNDKSDEIVARSVGLSVDKFQALSQPDYRRVVAGFWKAATQALDGDTDNPVKNSPSESIAD